MVVKEHVVLKDGRQIVVDLTDEEHFYLLSYAINNLIANGMMAIGQVDGEEVIGDLNLEKNQTKQ